MKKKTKQQILEETYYAAQKDTVIWALRNIVLPKKHLWNFKDRVWQEQILSDNSPRIVVKKSAQVGFTTTFLCKVIHYLNYHSATAMWTLPRRDDISDFVNGTLDPIIQQSPHLSTMVRDTDSVRLKKFRAEIPGESGAIQQIESYFHLMEGSVEPRMIPVDVLANDEIDRSDQDYLDQFVARLDESPDPHHFQFSTPTVPGYGIDRIYENSTQNEWMVKCPACGTDQVLDWEKNFLATPEPRYACSHCRATLPNESIIHGRWVSSYPDKEIVGYRISHMMLPISRPVIGLWRELSENRITRKNFYNLRLGLAYSSAIGSFPREMLLEKLFTSKFPREYVPMSESPYYLGADQGNQCHILIGKLEGGKKKIVYAERTEEKGEAWNKKIMTLARLFHVRFMVVDALPNTHDAREIVDEFKGDGDRVALCHYTDGELMKRDKDEGKVFVNKVETFDGLRTEISDAVWQLYGSPTDIDSTRIIDHFTNMKRDEREDNKGQIKGVWINTGPDHWAHAANYLRIAMMLKKENVYSISILGSEQGVEVTEENKNSLEKVWGVGLETTDEN